jgi:hypothetical protein
LPKIPGGGDIGHQFPAIVLRVCVGADEVYHRLDSVLTDEIDVWHRRAARMFLTWTRNRPRLEQLALRNALSERSWLASAMLTSC